MDIDSDGYIHNTEIVKSVIHSNKKMTYDDVDLVLDGKEIPEGYTEYVNEINKTGKLSEIVIKKNNKEDFNNLLKVYNQTKCHERIMAEI